MPPRPNVIKNDKIDQIDVAGFGWVDEEIEAGSNIGRYWYICHLIENKKF